jgi:hypothetical protein
MQEPSTFAGFAGLAGAFGVAMPVYQASVTLVMAIASLAAILMADRPAS